MASKKKPVLKSPIALVARADVKSEPKAKPALTQATGTVKAINALVESKPAGQTVDAGKALLQPPKEPAASILAAPASQAAVAEIGGGPVQDLVASVFEGNPDREFTVNAVIEELKNGNPGVNENSIRFIITELKRKSVIHHVRNEGHYQILKFSKPGEAKPFPRPALVAKLTPKTAVKPSPADVTSDLALLQEASKVIVKLERLVLRNQVIFAQIEKLRSVF